MSTVGWLRSLRVVFLLLNSSLFLLSSSAHAQGAKQTVPQTPIRDADSDHVDERNEWFYRGRLVRGKASAELRRRAYQSKLQLRRLRAALAGTANAGAQPASLSDVWIPLGPMPLASDATGNGTQDYGWVAGRATAVAIDSADATGNTVYIGGAQSGVWKSTNAASADPSAVVWQPVTDDQATLSIGALAVQPGNNDPNRSIILAATGEANSSADSYFGLGILRSADAGSTWTLVPTANGGALSFSGLGGTRIAFSTAGQMNTVVAAMATTSEGLVVGAVTSTTKRGLYTSLDAGAAWTYDAIVDPGGATDATSATSVVYNATAGLFFAAVRYHGFYSSPDGVNWTRLANQPGGALLNTTACPPQSTSNNYACPIYRAELTVVPGRNEMYAWIVYFSPGGQLVDGGIWQTLNGAATPWTPIPDNTIANCGDFYGCGVLQGAYNLELLAVPNCPSGQNSCTGNPTDLYAGAINLYKCSITTQNPTCATLPFINLTHVYGCYPISALAHVHPDQHTLAYAIPSGTANALLYFANDGGIYRALNGFGGLNSGSCTVANRFDNLNQNLGSMTQFVSFSQHPSDPNTLLGGTQDNGSPATATATTRLSWGNVLGGDGGYNAIDPNAPSNFYASNPDIPPGGLEVQLCRGGVNCTNGGFSAVVTSGSLGGDDGAFYFPYVLDSSPAGAMLIGTCRVWRGPRIGGAFTVLSPNFETLGSGTCSGEEVNQVRAIAAGGPTDSKGSEVVYATTSGLGPLDGSMPVGGRVWVTTNASAGISSFVDVTNNSPQGNINPNQFPISGVAIDSSSDPTGHTAYVTIMGFTGGLGHVWKTTNAGASWIDFTYNLPDSPVNAVVVYAATPQVMVATDVGVFTSSTVAPNWTEVGPVAIPGNSGFLPNVAVTALGIFSSGGQQWLRAATYGRGVWQFNLAAAPDFQISVSNSPQSVMAGVAATFRGTASALNGFSGAVTLTCVAGTTAPPPACSSPQSPLTPAIATPFTIIASGGVGDYYFGIQAVGSDSNHSTRVTAAVLHVLSSMPDFALAENGSFPLVKTGGTTVGDSVNVTAVNGFTGTINLSCSVNSASGSCSILPAVVTSIPTTASVTVNATNLSAGSYQLTVQGSSGAITHILVIPFNVGDFQVAEPAPIIAGPGTIGTGLMTVTGSTYYSGNIISTCSVTSLTGSTCSVIPGSTSLNPGTNVPLTANINVPGNATPGGYNVTASVQDISGAPSHSVVFPLVVQDFRIDSSVSSQTANPGETAGPYTLTVQPIGTSFSNPISFTCTAGLPGGSQCAFQPSAPVTPGGAPVTLLLTISTSASTAAGDYRIAVTGTSGALAHSAAVQLTVKNPVVNTNDFQLAIAQPFPSALAAGSQANGRVAIAANYNGSVNANCDASAISGQCVVAPENPFSITANTAVSVALAVNLPNTVTPGTYNIKLTISDSSGQPSHSIQLPMTVIQDFSVSCGSPCSQTVTAGQTTGAYQLTVAPNPPGSTFSGTVMLSCDPASLPANAKCLFNPSASITPGNTAQSVVLSISTAATSSALPPDRSWLMLYASWLLLLGLLLQTPDTRPGLQKGKASVRMMELAILLWLAAALPSCGGVSSGGSQGTPRNPVTYHVIVTGSSAGTPADAGQSTTATLIVQ